MLTGSSYVSSAIREDCTYSGTPEGTGHDADALLCAERQL